MMEKCELRLSYLCCSSSIFVVVLRSTHVSPCPRRISFVFGDFGWANEGRHILHLDFLLLARFFPLDVAILLVINIDELAELFAQFWSIYHSLPLTFVSIHL